MKSSIRFDEIEQVELIPGWLIEARETLHAELKQLESVHQSLLKMSEVKLQNRYSNAKVHEMVARQASLRAIYRDEAEEATLLRGEVDRKVEQCQKILTELANKKNHIKKIINGNDAFFRAQIQLFENRRKPLLREKEKLIKALIDWQKIPHDEKINFPRKLELQLISMELLKEWAKKTNCESLVMQAEKLVVDVKQWEKEYHDFRVIRPVCNAIPIMNAMPAFHFLEAAEFALLRQQQQEAKHLTKAYLDASNQLKTETTEVYNAFEKERNAWLEQVDLLSDRLQLKINVFKDAIAKAKKEYPDRTYSIAKNTHTNLMSAYHAAVVSLASLQKKGKHLVQRYHQYNKNYDSQRDELIGNFEYQVETSIKKFDDVIKIAKSSIDAESVKMLNIKRYLARKRYLDLIYHVIMNHEDFWHEQVSFFGSRHKIGEVSVPNGIKQMYDVLANKENKGKVSEKFPALKKAAESRIKAGTGLFARRAMTTTDKFYDLIFNLEIDLVNAEIELARVEGVLKEINPAFLNLPSSMNVDVIARSISFRGNR